MAFPQLATAKYGPIFLIWREGEASVLGGPAPVDARNNSIISGQMNRIRKDILRMPDTVTTFN